MLPRSRRVTGGGELWDQTFQSHPVYRGRTVPNVWSELLASAVTAQRERSILDTESEWVVGGVDHVRAMDTEWWPFGGPDWYRDDPHDLALRRVLAEAKRERDMTRRKAGRSRFHLMLLLVVAVVVGLVRTYLFLRWETFSAETQDMLRVGWLIAIPLLILLVAFVVSSIGKRRDDV